MANNRTLIIDDLKVCHVNCQSLVAHLDEFRTFFMYSGYHIICLSETWLRPEVTDDFVNFDGFQLYRWDRVGLVYRPPHCGDLQEFCDAFRDLSVLYSHSVIFGDFNADLSTASFDAGRVLDFVDCASFYLIPYTSTHHTRSSSTWLDLCIVDDSEKVVSYGQHDVSFLSSHDLIHITYKIKVDRTQAKDIWARDLRTFDFGEFTRDLLAKNWTRFYEVDSVDHKVELFNSFLLESFDLHAPERLIRPRKLPAPWLSEEIKRRMRERDRVRGQWRKHKCDRLHRLFKDLRNEVQILVRNAKKSYFTNFFSNCSDPGTAWNELRHLGIIKSKNSGRPLPCSTEELNLYFSSTGDRGEALDSVLPCIGGVGLDENKFFWSGVTPEEVVSALSGASSRVRGIDRLPSRLLRIALPCLLPEMLHIFESFFTLNTFPTLWKRALVVPLPKVRVPEAPQHYRPISILCSISKSAYKRGFSTQTALIRVLDDVRSAADKRMVTVSVFFDFSKAFDCVSHRLLITKLAALGFSNSVLHWLGSYLSDRCQAVRDTSSGNVSSFIEMGSGVPQGSVLGPLLFSLFLFDFRHVLQHYIERIIFWTLESKLRLNPGKSKAVIFGTARYLNCILSEDLPAIRVNGVEVTFSDSIESDLGVRLMSNLSWEGHVSKIVKKVSCIIHQLKLCKDLFPRCVRHSLVQTLVLPHFDYCCVLLTDITGVQNAKLQRSLNTCVRFICVKVITALSSEKLRDQPPDLRNHFFEGCRRFLITNCIELKKRFDFKDPVLPLLESFTTMKAMSQNYRTHRPSLLPIMTLMPRIVHENSYQKIDDEWRQLPFFTLPGDINSDDNADIFWSKILKIKNEEVGVFSNLMKCAFDALVVPHSNAECERVFSKVNLCKTKVRNKLITDSIEGLLLTSQHLNKDCIKVEPTKNMLAKMTTATLYPQTPQSNQSTEDSENDDVMLGDDDD
ncbi:PREDICTED: uncharacterized protein LOC105556015 [Vollenhovia emeryi]|uniref:uncharacterized protein LOC105556015 n=1 Tax=Vollenhovia emeryi TaxID=411798 RepID=UPI0005F42275|nr:PREDICTED: uncharacterized protein LOC105556015 [Vollenhovia emeryi]